jgi:molybdopterin-containing oxidoreductase family iron-sulfur binding subunit
MPFQQKESDRGGEQMSGTNLDRRDFLTKSTVGFAGLAIAPGMMLFDLAHARPAGEAVTNKVRWGMLIDNNKCESGCNDCVTACSTENGLSGGTKPTDSQWIRKIELKDLRTERASSLPMMCQHCEQPPCVDVCPTGASFKRADGIVLVDRHLCIGCRYCMMACPYKARSFVHEPLTEQKTEVPRGKGCVESCTLCVHRIDNGQTTTACQDACAKAGHNAILFGDLNDPESEIAKRIRAVASNQVRADLGLNPGVQYEGI